VRELINTYRSVFSETVGTTPAKLPPMELHLIEGHTWFTRQNQTPARAMAPDKLSELEKQLRLLEQLGVISRTVTAQYWSHVVLLKKPQKRPEDPIKWRLCIDYRALNKNLVGMEWSIPNIKLLLQRIGQKKPMYFAVLDLTSGYHQVALHINSRDLAAFATPFGIFVPNRISMGLKCAPAYFQYLLSTNVLCILLYNGCELYIDDIIIYGSTEEEFVQNLETVFVWLKNKGLTLNPDKAKILLREVEAVGHVINKYGIKMSEEKISKVMNFPIPKFGKQLKQFLGLANYFRDHVRNHSTLAQPLDKLIGNYKMTKHKLIQWTAETMEAFRTLQAEVAKCPMLYFLEEQGKIVLETDASDYGIGAYLYQIVVGQTPEVRPIAFMSRTLNATERRWATIEKECCAIYEAVKGWEYLIGGRFFTIKTDHKNLLYLNDPLISPKVVKWKLALLEFNFEVEYIQGPDNVVADCLSRIQREEEKNPNDVLQDLMLDDKDDSEYKVSKRGGTKRTHSGEAKSKARPREVILANIRSMRVDSNGDVTADGVSRRVLSGEPLQPAPHHALQEGAIQYDLTELGHMLKVHNHVMGHHGVERTLNLLTKSGVHWAGMRRHVHQFVKNCPYCQRIRDIKIAINASAFTTATYSPMDRINMDLIGPLPEDEKKNVYILVIIDCFSRFVELYAIESKEATPIAYKLLEWVGRYGFPRTIISDRGEEFKNHLFTSLATLVGAGIIETIAYSKEENALVERTNKEVMRHLRGYVYDQRLREKWSIILPLVQRIMNSMVHSTTGVSPAQVLFGNAVDLDKVVLVPELQGSVQADVVPPSVKEYLDKLVHAQGIILELAQKNQEEHDRHHLAQASAGAGELTTFPINSYVLLQYPAGLGGDHRPPSKLHTRWQGPFRVIGSRGDKYTLQNLVTMRSMERHVKELIPYHHNPFTDDPVQEAIKDANQYVVERIITHTGNWNVKSTLQFRVRWRGYTEQDDTWEPWKNIRTNVRLHEYLRSIGKANQIPAPFRNAESNNIGIEEGLI